VTVVLAFPMVELLFIAPIQQKDPRRPTWRGMPRVSFSRPAVAAELDPIVRPPSPTVARVTRSALSIGTVAIILDGDYKGKRAVVVTDLGAGVVGLAGPVVPYVEVDQDFLIATSTKIPLDGATPENAAGLIDSAASKVPELREYLAAPFSLKPGDRPHLMKF
jgi:large subunit ribosomal protein L6e